MNILQGYKGSIRNSAINNRTNVQYLLISALSNIRTNRGTIKMTDSLDSQKQSIISRTWRSYGGGLFLVTQSSGKKIWMYNKMYKRHRPKIKLGDYPDLKLKDARGLLAETYLLEKKRINDIVINGQNPPKTFSEVYFKWLKRKIEVQEISDSYAFDTRRRAEIYILPRLGNKLVRDIHTQEVIEIIEELEKKKCCETAHKVLGICSGVINHARICGYCDYNPVEGLRDIITAKKTNHRAAVILPDSIGLLMNNILTCKSTKVRNVLLFLAYTFVRPIEACSMEWREIKWDVAEWHLPAEKTKKRKPLIVPLSAQCIGILQEMQAYYGENIGKYVFAGNKNYDKDGLKIIIEEKHLTTSAVLQAIRWIGYTKEEMCGHGFRAMANTRLKEQRAETGKGRMWTDDAIQLQLGHKRRDPLDGAYDRTAFMEERAEMMQWYADYLDLLKEKALSSENRENTKYKVA